MTIATKRALTILYSLVYAFIYAGWLFHRSGDPGAGGFIYSPGYLAFLAAAALPFFVPTVLSRLSRLGGLRPIGLALIPALVLLVVAYVVAAEVYYSRQLHLFDPFVQVPAPRLAARREPNAPGAFRILCIGGSTTGGDTFLRPETRYPAVLERMLRERYPDVQITVFNAGRAWYTTRHTLINYVTYYQDWTPDLVIEMHGINDIVRSFSPALLSVGKYDALYTHFYGPAINGAKPPPFERVLLNVLGRLTYAPRTAWFSELIPRVIEKDYPLERYESIQPFEGNLRKMAKLTRDNGSAFMLLTQPSLYHANLTHAEHSALTFGEEFCVTKLNVMQEEIPSPVSLGRAMTAFNDVTRRVAADEHVALCEGEAAVAKTLTNFVDDVHHTRAGAEELARAVARSIVDARFIEGKAAR